MQSVEPRFSCPFWDFTIDATAHVGHIDKLFSESWIFDENHFGRTEGPLKTVTRGRFAYTSVPYDQDFTLKSPFGFLRAPWNANPSQYLTRYHKMCGVEPDWTWPSCEIHWKLATSYDSWYDWAWDAGYAPHGPVHIWIGGVGGSCESWADDEDFAPLGADGLYELQNMAFDVLRVAWRHELFESPRSCSLDSPDDCRWHCHLEELGLQTFVDALGTAGTAVSAALDTMDPAAQQAIVRKVFCDKPYWPGDHLEAAATIEASFWPIHPGLERLLQYRLIYKPFPSTHDWTNPDGETLMCSEQAWTRCDGHNPLDRTYWQVVYREQPDGAYVKRHLQNAEVLDKLNPGSYALPYIYAHFRWEHCQAEGIYFPEVGSRPQ